MILRVLLCAGLMLGVFVSAHAQTLGPSSGQCKQVGGYPFSSGQCLNGTDLSNVLELSIGGSPPQNAYGQGAGQGKLWLDTSVAPALLRLCSVAPPGRCGTSYVPAQWLTWTAVDFVNQIISRPIGGGVTSVASSGVVDLGLYPQAVLQITGTASISSFGTSLPAGQSKVLIFQNATTIVNNSAAIAIPSGVNITTQIGGMAFVTSQGGGLYSLLYQPQPTGVGLTPISNNTVLGNTTGANALPGQLTPAQLTTLCNTFSNSLSGCVPASPGGAFNYLGADTAFHYIPYLTAQNLAVLQGFSGMPAGTSARRTDIDVTYTYSTVNCPLNSGSGDNGSQIKPTSSGGCWNWTPPIAGTSPMTFNATGNGTAADGTAVQNAINATSAAGIPLLIDTQHLYNINGTTLTVTAPLAIRGPFRYGFWTTTADGSTRTCTWGFSKTDNATLFNVSSVTSSITDVCMLMGSSTGGAGGGVSATAGAAINLAPPNTSSFQTGVHIERNTLLNVFDGIDISGAGYSSACCGKGTTADGVVISQNTIINPAHIGIEVGVNTAGAATPGITVFDNAIGCINATSKASGVGIALYDGGIYYDGTQNGPEGCNVGIFINPGVVSSVAQIAEFNGSGVFGDQSGAHDLWIQPQAGGEVDFVTVGGIGPWAGATTNVNSILINCQATGSSCQEFNFTGLTVHGGAGLTQPVFDVEGGAGGPYDLSIVGSNICQFGTPGSGAVGLKLNLNGANNGRFVVTGNRIGTGCPGGALATGVQLGIAGGSSGYVTLTSNDISAVASPITYTPTATDHVIIANNMGLDDGVASITLGSTITLPTAGPKFFASGSGTLSTINGAWAGRTFTMEGPSNISTNTSGNICANALTNQPMVIFTWTAGGLCWSHVP